MDGRVNPPPPQPEQQEWSCLPFVRHSAEGLVNWAPPGKDRRPGLSAHAASAHAASAHSAGNGRPANAAASKTNGIGATAYARQCERGRRLGLALALHIRRYPGLAGARFGDVIAAMVARGRFEGVERGFCAAIARYLTAQPPPPKP